MFEILDEVQTLDGSIKGTVSRVHHGWIEVFIEVGSGDFKNFRAKQLKTWKRYPDCIALSEEGSK